MILIKKMMHDDEYIRTQSTRNRNNVVGHERVDTH